MRKTHGTVTAEELARMPENGMRLELVRGEVREMSPPKSRHGRIANAIQYALTDFIRSSRQGKVFAEVGFLIERDPDTVRAPDCAFVRAARLPEPLPDEFLPFAPDLAVEVLSRGDRPGEVREKVGDWLAAGSRAVWVIDPDRRQVTVHRPGEAPRVLGEGDALEGEDVLPGFSIPVAALFD